MIKISLGHYKNLSDGSKIQVPYWFTRDSSGGINTVFLNTKTPSLDLDELELSKTVLIEIHNGVTDRNLLIDDFDKLLKAITGAVDAPIVIENNLPEAINTANDLKKKKADEAKVILDEKVIELLKNSFNSAKKVVGSAELNDDKSLKEGIADVALLEAAIAKESEKGDDARSSIVKLLEKRIRIIGKSSGFMRVDEEDVEVEITMTHQAVKSPEDVETPEEV